VVSWRALAHIHRRCPALLCSPCSASLGGLILICGLLEKYQLLTARAAPLHWFGLPAGLLFSVKTHRHPTGAPTTAHSQCLEISAIDSSSNALCRASRAQQIAITHCPSASSVLRVALVPVVQPRPLPLLRSAASPHCTTPPGISICLWSQVAD